VALLHWTFGQAAVHFCLANRSFKARVRVTDPTLLYFRSVSPCDILATVPRETHTLNHQEGMNHLFNVPKMDNMLLQNTAPTASSLTRDILHEETMPLLPSRNMMLSKKDWEDLKSIIREQYLDRGQTLKQLAKYLEEHHRFKPT
jgi:hypothetical protein